MRNVVASDFSLAACQAAIFTPDGDASAKRFSLEFPKRWQTVFDGSPVILPPLQAPVEVPRTILQSTTGWHCEMAPARFNLHWRQLSDAPSTPLASFLNTAMPLMVEYISEMKARVGRIALIITRYTKHDSPGRFLATHFCRDRWLTAPFNRPEDFELHAHKKYPITSKLVVNSWVRNKTAFMTSAAGNVPVIVVEQDLNTLTEEIDTRDFSEVEIREFCNTASGEFDQILSLYYPENT